VSLARRDRDGRAPAPLAEAAAAAADAVDDLHRSLIDEARAMLERRTVDVDGVPAAIEAARDGFARLPWAACGEEGERTLNAEGVSVRCLTLADGSMPASLDDPDLVATVARAY